MADDLEQLVADGQYAVAGVGVFVGLAVALFFALMWLRVWRWLFGLFGLRA